MQQALTRAACRKQLGENRRLCPQEDFAWQLIRGETHGWAARDPSWMQAGHSAWKNFAHLTNGLPKRAELREESSHINVVNRAAIFPRRFWFLGEEGVPKGFISLQSYLFPACFPCRPCLSTLFNRAPPHHSKLFFDNRGANSNRLPPPCMTTSSSYSSRVFLFKREKFILGVVNLVKICLFHVLKCLGKACAALV